MPITMQPGTLPKISLPISKRPSLVGILGPALVALAAVLLEPFLTVLTQGREAVLPCIMVALMFALVHPRFRHLLVVVLCYGVAFLALRDTFFRHDAFVLPPRIASQIPFDLNSIDLVRRVGLLLVAILAASAAVVETSRPGTVWARRCYFGAASLYFSGLGVINYVWHSSWQSLLLCVTGVTALFGSIFADRIVASENDYDTGEEIESEKAQQEADDKHRQALRDNEWHDRQEIA